MKEEEKEEVCIDVSEVTDEEWERYFGEMPERTRPKYDTEDVLVWMITAIFAMAMIALVLLMFDPLIRFG